MQSFVRGLVTLTKSDRKPHPVPCLPWFWDGYPAQNVQRATQRFFVEETHALLIHQATAVTATQSGLRGCAQAALRLTCSPFLYHMRSICFKSGHVPSVSRRRAQRARQLHCSCSILPSPQLQDVLQPSRQQCRFDQSQHGPKSAEQLYDQQQQNQQQHEAQPWQMTRRDAVVLPVMGGLALQLGSWVQPRPAAASKLGAAADSAWEAIGGGPADLTFPESW